MTVVSPSFVSRESQLKKLGHFLASLQASPPGHSVMVFGPTGVGKSTLLKQMKRSFRESTIPIVILSYGRGVAAENYADFMSELARGVQSEWPGLSPFVDAFSNLEFRNAEAEPSEIIADFLGKVDEHFLQSEQQEIHPELADLQILFIVEDLDLLGASEIEFLGRMKNALKGYAQFSSRYHFIFTGNEKSTTLELVRNILKDDAVVEEILLAPFSRPESEVILTGYGVDPEKFADIHNQTGGLPARLVEYGENYKPKDPLEAKQLEMAEEILRPLANEQREWIKIAALLPICDEENLGLFLSKEQKVRAMQWIKMVPLSCVEVKGDYVQIGEKEKNMLQLFQQKEHPGKFRKRLKKVHQLESVKRVVPKYEHRFLLSVLAEFNHFDREVLSYVFGDKAADQYMNLVETKTVFFSVQSSRIRLSQNAKIMMQLYKQLYPVKDLPSIKQKVSSFWATKTESLNRELEEIEEKISGNESIRGDVKTGISQLDSKITSLAHTLSIMDKERKTMIVKVKRSPVGYLSIILQVLGIVCLYFAVLYQDEFLMPVLVVAGLLITVGFAISLKRRGNVKVSHTKILRQSEKRNRTAKELEHLNKEKLQLAMRRDQSINLVHECKERTMTIQLLLKQPYMRV